MECNGLHQFLQLKHHLRLSAESLKAVFMSNISFFSPKYYFNVMGVTGTLGSKEEYNLFRTLYSNIEVVKLPRNQRSRLRIRRPLCLPTEAKWVEAVDTDVKTRGKRSGSTAYM